MYEVDLVINAKRRQKEMIREAQHYNYARTVEHDQRKIKAFSSVRAIWFALLNLFAK